MTFDEWLEIGMRSKWATPVVCATHDGIPTSTAEDSEIDEGFDPCLHVVRVCEPEHWQDIYNNTPSMKWRHTQ